MSAFVRCGSLTISGCVSLSSRKPWLSEKWRWSRFSLRLASSLIRSVNHAREKNWRPLSIIRPRSA